MKIGILTYHRVINDGSILQAYCLYNFIKSLVPGARVEIIDYRPLRTERVELKKILSKRPPFLKVSQANKYYFLRHFIKDKFQFSDSICTDSLPKAKLFIEKQGYDTILVGSDTVWEFRSSKYVPPPPNIYYLPGIKGVKKIAFAASSDPINPEFIQKLPNTAEVMSCINDFDCITTRDDPTMHNLVKMGVSKEKIFFMPDPTFMWDFSDLVQKQNVVDNKKKPLAGIAIGQPFKKMVIPILQQLGFDIFDFENRSGGLRNVQLKTLHQRLGLYLRLDMLVTDRFHSSIFALKLAGIPVIFVETTSKWPSPNSKGRDLFERLGIEAMVLRSDGREINIASIQEQLERWPELCSGLIDRFADLKKNGMETTKKMLNL